MKPSGKDYYLGIELVQGTVWIKDLLLDYIVGGEVELRGQGQAGAGSDHEGFDKLQSEASQNGDAQGLESQGGSIYLIGNHLGGEVDLVQRLSFTEQVRQGVQGPLMAALGDKLFYLFSVWRHTYDDSHQICCWL